MILLADPPAPPLLPAAMPERDRVATALRALADAVDFLEGAPERRIDPRALAAVCRLDDLPGLFEEALTWDAATLEPFDAASLVWCLSRAALRDVALLQWCEDLAAGDEAFEAQLRWQRGEEYPAHLAMALWGEGEPPDAGRLRRALALTRRIAALSPAAEQPGALATCAWLAWALGDSGRAAAWSARACDLEPEHGLAEIVRSFVVTGHQPEWRALT